VSAHLFQLTLLGLGRSESEQIVRHCGSDIYVDFLGRVKISLMSCALAGPK